MLAMNMITILWNHTGHHVLDGTAVDFGDAVDARGPPAG